MTALPTMADALAAGDGCLHALIDALEAQVAADKKYIKELEDANTPELVSLREQVAALTLENENVKRANLDCVDHFNALKVDYDEAAKQVAVLRKALNGFIANSCRVDWPADIYDAAIAAQKGTV